MMFVPYRCQFPLFPLDARESNYSDKDMEEIQSLLRSTARDCLIEERNSFVAFQANTGVEVIPYCLLHLFIVCVCVCVSFQSKVFQSKNFA